jgi:hypothetical protein
MLCTSKLFWFQNGMSTSGPILRGTFMGHRPCLAKCRGVAEHQSHVHAAVERHQIARIDDLQPVGIEGTLQQLI